MMINYIDKFAYLIHTSRWLMGQTLYTEKTESFVGYKGKGLKWGEINDKIADNIDFLELCPDDISTFKIPECIAQLPNLKALIIPSWFVSHLTENSFPHSLECLIIGAGCEKNSKKIYWDSNKRFVSVKCVDLNRVVSNFWSDNFPNLEKTLFLTLGNKKLNLNELNKCDKLNNLFINLCEDINSINSFNRLNINFLNLNFSKNQDFIGLSGFKNLTELDISGNRKLISLEGVENLKKIEKLAVTDCPSLTYLDNIAETPSLKEMLIMSCGKEWLRNIESTIRKFKKAGFQSIKYEQDGVHSVLEVFRNE